jgi:hypothetical protein
MWPDIFGFASTTTATTYIPTWTCAAQTSSSSWTSQIVEIDEELYLNNREYFELARQRGYVFRIRTEAAWAAAQLQHQERNRRAAEADARARELLVSHLTDEQRDTLEKHKWFVVIGSMTRTAYRIRTDAGIAGNIAALAGPHISYWLCCHLRTDLPAHDHFLAQKLAIEYDEPRFLFVANKRAA